MSAAYCSRLSVGVVLAGHDEADVEAEPLVDAPHPLGVANAGQVVVDRDEVDALAGQPVEVDGQRRHEGLALAGLHLGDPAEVQRGAAHQLHVVVALADDPLGGLAGDRERLDEQMSSRSSPLSSRWRNSAVLARSSSSESALDTRARAR
jgi:hypothetical protein